MRLQNLAGNGQSQAGSTFLGGKERFEDLLLHVAAHPPAGIGEHDFGSSVSGAGGDHQLAASVHRLPTVAQQIEEHLSKLRLVGQHTGGQWI